MFVKHFFHRLLVSLSILFYIPDTIAKFRSFTANKLLSSDEVWNILIFKQNITVSLQFNTNNKSHMLFCCIELYHSQ